MKKINLTLWFLAAVLTIFNINFVCAAGVSQPYWEGYPLKISPGETKIVELGLQNMVSDNDITMRAILVNDAGIASLPEKIDYLVKAGTSDTKVPVTIKIPDNASAEDGYVISLAFKTVTSGEGGGVAMGTGYTVNFDVLVVAPTPEEKPVKIPIWIIITAGIALLIIITTIMLKKRKK